MSYKTFPLDPAIAGYGTTYVPSWNIAEKVSANGARRAITHQLQPAWKFNVKFPMLSEEQSKQLMSFYNQCKGALIPFFWKDFTIGAYIQAPLTYNSSMLGYQFLHNMDGYTEACPKAEDIKALYVNGNRVEKFFYHEKEDGSGCYITYSGMSSIDTVKCDFHGYFLVHFPASITITEKFDNFYTANFALEVVR